MFEKRCNEIKNSKINSSRNVIIKIITILLILIVYLIINFVKEVLWVNDFETLLAHLSVVNSINPDVRYARTFVLEEISVGNISEVYRNESKDGGGVRG